MGNFVAHDHKSVWNHLDSQLQWGSSNFALNPVKDKDGVMKYRAEEIVEVMKTHYEDLLTYDPDGKIGNNEYWDIVELGEGRTEMFELNLRPTWPDILVTIQKANRNTATGKDGVHINVLKAMVVRSWPHFSFLFGLPPCYVIPITLSLVLTTFCLPRLWTIYKPRTVVLGQDYLCFILGSIS